MSVEDPFAKDAFDFVNSHQPPEDPVRLDCDLLKHSKWLLGVLENARYQFLINRTGEWDQARLRSVGAVEGGMRGGKGGKG